MTTPGPDFGLLLVVDAFIALCAAYFVYIKDPKGVLNRLVALALFSFCIFFFSSGLIYIFAFIIDFQSNESLCDQLRLISSVFAISAASLAAFTIRG